MKNNLISKLKSKVIVQIIGRNPSRLILRINKNNINIYRIKKINNEKYNIIIEYKDFDKLLKLNTIYEINIIDYLGNKKISNQIFKNKHLIFFFIISILALYIFSNIIFTVEVITNDTNMKKKLYSSLKYYDIKPFSFVKKYSYIEKIKEEILDSYKDEIEWLEIEKKGTKYIVRYEERVVKKNFENKKKQNVVARKNAIIKSIIASNGQVIKQYNNYVKKGDIIISGTVYLGEEIKDIVSAKGVVYGEVWYETKVVYPFNYYEKIKTGNKKNVYSIKVFNKEIEILNLNPYKNIIEEKRVLLSNSVLPISFNKKIQNEVILKTGMNTKEELEIKAVELAYKKMNDSLKDGEYIIGHKILDSIIIDKGIEMKIFFSVYENITEYKEVEVDN